MNQKYKFQKESSYEKGSERFATFLFSSEKKSMAIQCLNENKDSREKGERKYLY